MKSLILTIFAHLFTIACLAQQTETNLFTDTKSEKYSAIQQSQPSHLKNKANWDIQFSLNSTAAGGGTGQAGVALINNEFWVSKWANDTLMTFSNTGTLLTKFVIAGLSGTRAITTDGNYVYISNNTQTIYRVNPLTKVLAPPHITSAAGTQSRFLTYDPTLNSGGGGFWTGNFNTDIYAISMTGAVLSSIPAATHGLTGMYGAAIDNYSTGGPYLWIYSQSLPDNCQLTALQLPAGTQTVFTISTLPDFSALHGLTSGLAGGLFLSNSFVSGEISLIGLLQGDPSNVLFAYEIDVNTDYEDVAVTAIRPESGYTKIPAFHISPEIFSVGYVNNSTGTVDTIYADVDFTYNGSTFHSEKLMAANIASAGGGILLTSPVSPFQLAGNYKVSVTMSANAGFTDNDATNDTMSFSFEVTDSIFARDNDVPDGSGYSVSSTDCAYAVTLYELERTDSILGVWIKIATPNNGDTTYAVLYNHDNTLPTTQIALGEVVIINAAQNDYFLPFANPVPLPAGKYVFGCYEGVNTTINLAQSTMLYTPGTNFFLVGNTLQWTSSGINTARFIRPVFKSHDFTAINEFQKVNIQIFPVPATDEINVLLGYPATEKLNVDMFDINGKLVFSDLLMNGLTSLKLNVNALEKGIYCISVSGRSFSHRQKVVIY